MLNYQKVFNTLEKDHKATMLEQFVNYSKFQLLISTMLSSRTKDSTTIPIVKKMFKKWSKPEDFLKVDLGKLEQELYGIGFYKVKAKNIKKLSQKLLDEFDGKVPSTLEGMTSLPGVGRKTANCMLNYAFGIPAVAVDIHVHRISNRLGWIETSKPEESEIALMKALPRELWTQVNKLLVNHGQTICLPINPKCEECKISKYCNYDKKIK